MNAMNGSDDVTAGLKKILRWLSLKDHSKKQVEIKLKKTFSKEVVEKILAEALKKRWLKDDSQFAKDLIEKLHRQNRGHQWICQSLQQQGLLQAQKELVEDVEREKEKALSLLAKKASGKTFLQKKNLLAYRGFSEFVIEEVVQDEEPRN